jgi:hypothetical protein
MLKKQTRPIREPRRTSLLLNLKNFGKWQYAFEPTGRRTTWCA